MAKKSTRKLFLFGRYSLALLLPKKWLTEMGIKEGELVNLEFDRARKRIVVRFNGDPTTQDSPPPPKNSPAKKSTDSDWQPIPQL